MTKGPSAGCCCFLNNVRFLILILTTLAISALYSNLILFHLTSILHTDLKPEDKPVFGLDSLFEYSIWHDRLKRSTENDIDEGHPILPSTTTTKPTTTLPLITRKKTEKPKTFFITNSSPKTTTTTTTTTEPPTTTEYDVVRAEVERSLKKIEAAQKQNSTISKDFQTLKNVEDEGPKRELSVEISRTLLYAAPGLGVLAGIGITIQLSRCMEIRKLFALVLLISAVLTCSTPFAIHISYFALLILRFLQGACFSIVFPVMGTVLISWGSLKEQMFFIVTMFLFVSFGSCGSWPLTSLLNSNEVPLYMLYALHSGSLIILALVWIIFYRDRPEQHPWVSGVELNRIVAGKVQELQSKRTPSDSYSTLTKSLSAWSIWLSAFGFYSVTAFFAIYLPALCTSSDLFFVDNLGLYAILPFLILPIFCAVAGYLVMSVHPSTKTVRIMNTVSFVFEALIILAIPVCGYFAPGNTFLYVLGFSMFPLILALLGGFLRSLTIVGRVFAKQIVEICGVSFGVAFIVQPIIVGAVVEKNQLNHWIQVLMALVFILLVVAVEFAVFGRGRSASWAESSWDPLVASTKMQSLALIDFNQDECGLYELRRVEPSVTRP